MKCSPQGIKSRCSRCQAFSAQPEQPSLSVRPRRVRRVRISFTVRKCGFTENHCGASSYPSSRMPNPDTRWQLCRHLCKMGQTRLFPASIMMFRERVRRTSLTIGGWTWEPQGNPGKNLTKRHSPASRKKWRSPASPSLRGTGRQPEKTRNDRVITASRRSYFLESSRSKRPSTSSRLSLVSPLFNRIE